MRTWAFVVFLLAAACAAERTFVFRSTDRTPEGERTMVQIRGARADIAEITCRAHSVRGDTLRVFCTPRTENVELGDISIVRVGKMHRIFYSVAHTAPDDGRAVERIEAFYDPGLASSDFWKAVLLMVITGSIQLLVVLTVGPYTIRAIWLAMMGTFYICRDAVQYVKRSFRPMPLTDMLQCICPAYSAPTDVRDKILDTTRGRDIPEGSQCICGHTHYARRPHGPTPDRLTRLITKLATKARVTEEEIERVHTAIVAGDRGQIFDMIYMFYGRCMYAPTE